MARAKRSVSFGLFVLCLALGLFVVARQPAQMPGRTAVIIDTDAGTDDLIAIAFLLARPDVEIQAITTVNGLAHADAGARNIQRLLRAANRRVDVYVGADQPLEGHDAFPAEWRRQADEMIALAAPASRRPLRSDAVSALLARLRDDQGPVSILALGPLTNIAQALERDPRTVARAAQLVVMGGAIDVAGNAPDNAASPVAEWNMFVDPTAASLVFRSGLPIVLVPLDATNHVPIDRAFVSAFAQTGRRPLGTIVADLLASQETMIAARTYYAWDPLAAAVTLDAGVVQTREMNVQIARAGDQRGQTRIGNGDPNAFVAYSASPPTFKRLFLGALTRSLP